MNGRNLYVVIWLALLFVISWMMSLGRLFGMRFYDREHVLEIIGAGEPDPDFYESTAFNEIVETYYTFRYIYFLPHVIGAIIWWNLYFIQLIPQIRKKFRSFHRYLGRVLMVAAMAQVITGSGLACTSHSSIIKIVSWTVSVSVLYCAVYAWYYAANKDIQKHKYWVMRLVGYLQTIALQRFWLLVLLISHQCGWHGLYPPITESSTLQERNDLVYSMFDDAFVLCNLHAILTTEWYLAGEYGWTLPPAATPTIPSSFPTTKDHQKGTAGEVRPLVPKL